MLAHFGASFWSLDRHTTCDTNWLDFLGHVSTNACRLSPVWNGHICMTCIPLRNGKRLRLHLLSPTCPDKSDRDPSHSRKLVASCRQRQRCSKQTDGNGASATACLVHSGHGNRPTKRVSSACVLPGIHSQVNVHRGDVS